MRSAHPFNITTGEPGQTALVGTIESASSVHRATQRLSALATTNPSRILRNSPINLGMNANESQRKTIDQAGVVKYQNMVAAVSANHPLFLQVWSLAQQALLETKELLQYRGNVVEDLERAPQSAALTKMGRKIVSSAYNSIDFSNKNVTPSLINNPYFVMGCFGLAVAQYTRAGFCDENGITSALTVMTKLAGSNIAKEKTPDVYCVKSSLGHCFSELRFRKDGQCDPFDIIIDSWFDEPTITLRQHSRLGNKLNDITVIFKIKGEQVQSSHQFSQQVKQQFRNSKPHQKLISNLEKFEQTDAKNIGDDSDPDYFYSSVSVFNAQAIESLGLRNPDTRL